RKPLCGECPVSKYCAFFLKGLAGTIKQPNANRNPSRKSRKAV
ncbi:A/G-specific adenine glycosylase, partial [bacterium]|nr:A/G-specific adenine glycosylase [bacterium]